MSCWTGLSVDIVEQCSTLQSVVVVGGRGTGKTFSLAAADRRLGELGFAVHRTSLSPTSEVMRTPHGLLAGITGLDFLDEMPSVPTVSDAIEERARRDERRGCVGIIDGFEHLMTVEWAPDLVDFLRALVAECSSFAAVLGGRPTMLGLFDGPTSPLTNVCVSLRAAPASTEEFRQWQEAQGVERGLAMRASRLVGGVSALVPAAIAALQADADETAAVVRVTTDRADWISAAVDDLNPAARVVLCELRDGPKTLRGLADRLGSLVTDSGLGLLRAMLLVRVQSAGQVALASPVAAIIAETVASQSLAQRPPLTTRDELVAHRICELEWRARGWLSERLSAASPGAWWDERVPSESRERAKERQELEARSGAVAPSEFLVDYLDFTDIRQVIELGENWRDCFQVVLGDWREALFAALKTLEAIRRKAAHSRPLSQKEGDEALRAIEFICGLMAK